MLRKQILLLGNKEMFLLQVKNIFSSRTQILLPKHMFPSVDTKKAMLTRFQCCSLSQFIIMHVRDPLFSETTFPRLATGAAKHLFCLPLI